ncbi:hypothetical protein PQ472_05285 [Lacticaseibacillus pabuli]|uniref:Holin n=1 Tax=Lacticaseibacillus pabuli TaxID=3025672 RepID=A0ABY7WV25_9LACO|nr:hypothetical protein [Lacticaseibacillus sp. KACC 23028]WDF83651.1 hypothetical protein PQ472_05285 [Lacticaseibacillus sp. KACC 23028]
MSTILLPGLISGIVAVIVAIVTSRTNIKTADKSNTASTEGIYAQELPELLEQIRRLNDERTKLSQQQIESDRVIAELRGQVRKLSAQLTELNQRLKEGEKNED